MSEPMQDPVEEGHDVQPSSPSDHDGVTNDIDLELLARAHALGDLPPTEQADALDRLNHDIVVELRAIEDL